MSLDVNPSYHRTEEIDAENAHQYLLVAVVGLAFASKGGGGDKKRQTIPLKTNFIPIRTTSGFTLKAGPAFTGSYRCKHRKDPKYVSFNTLVTYQNGNSILYHALHATRSTPAYYLHNNSGSNLRLLDLRINMH